jgi:hypothetical protein
LFRYEEYGTREVAVEQEWSPSVTTAPVFGLEVAAAERLLLTAMPPGWRVLGRCRYGTAGPAVHATGCHALAHPAFGIALIDVAPDATPNAESRLRRALGAVRFWEGFPGNLPVWHGRVEGGALRELDGMVRDAFADMPPLTVPGKSAWVAAAAAGLAEDAAWQVPGRPLAPAATPLMIEHEPSAPLRSRRNRRLAVGGAFALTFLVGLGAGVLMLDQDAPAPAPVRAVEASTQTGQEVAAVPATRAPPAEAPAAPAPPPMLAARPAPQQEAQPLLAAPAALAPATPAMAVAPPAEAMPAEAPPAPLPVATEAAAEPPPVPLPAEPMPAVAEVPPPQSEPLVLEAALPTPPPPPPRPAARPARQAQTIDRACRDAVFRFQQGATLSAAEQMHVRNGCATRR